MEYVICQVCAIAPSQRQCYITSCSHIVCEQCLAIRNGFCSVCKVATKTLKLDKNLPKNVKRMFMDPQTLAMEAHKRIARVLSFQKEQKAIQRKNELKREAHRKEQVTNMEKKEKACASQLQKVKVFREGLKKKIESAELENERLLELIKEAEEKISSCEQAEDFDDFFMKNTPTCSSQSEGSAADNEEMLEFDLLGLRDRQPSQDTISSLNSSRNGPLF